MATSRVLSLDGGGICGIIPAVLLGRIATEPGLGGWLEKADLIAGTSTGCLLARGIAKGLDLDTIEDLHLTRGREIFDDSWLDNVVDLGKVVGADYQCRQILGGRYARLAPVFPAGTTCATDGVEHVPAMHAFASGVDLSRTAAWIARNWI